MTKFGAMNKTLLTLLFSASALTTAHAGPENLVEPYVVWSKKQVSVCYASSKDFTKTQLPDSAPELREAAITSFTAAQKTLIKTAVTGAYSSAATGIEFVGWEECSKKPESDAYLFHISDAEQPFLGIASIGEAGNYGYVDVPLDQTGKNKSRVFGMFKDPSKKAFVGINTALLSDKIALKVDDNLKLTAIHEFGHLAGLRHEHADPTMMVLNEKKIPVSQDLNCQTVGFEVKELPFQTTFKTSVYDANSIMNYCFLYVVQAYGTQFGLKTEGVGKYFLFKDPSIITQIPIKDGMGYKIKIGLSKGDLHALKCLYSYDKNTVKRTCKDTYNPLTGK